MTNSHAPNPEVSELRLTIYLVVSISGLGPRLSPAMRGETASRLNA